MLTEAFHTVTQDMINQTLAYMKTFPTKCPPIEYIEDRRYQAGAGGNQKGISEDGGDVGYFETFQNNVKITKTVSYSVFGRTYTVTTGGCFRINQGWQKSMVCQSVCIYRTCRSRH